MQQMLMDMLPENAKSRLAVSVIDLSGQV